MGWLDKYKDGGVIEDDRGQWAHPGQITKINSNDITMQGVNYPVLGISNTGDKKLMMPGQDYKFQGNSVTEFPIKAQEGRTIIVNNKKDPRYQAYQDSLEVYNSYKNVEKNLKDNGYVLERHSKALGTDYRSKQMAENRLKHLKEKNIDASQWDGLGLILDKANKSTKSYAAYNNIDNLKDKYKNKIDKDKIEVLDLQDDMVNLNLKKQLFNKNIDPIAITQYEDPNKYFSGFTPDNFEFNGVGARLQQFVSNTLGGANDVRSVFNYSNANPKQKVIYQPDEDYDKTSTFGPPPLKTLKPREKQKPLKLKQEGLVSNEILPESNFAGLEPIIDYWEVIQETNQGLGSSKRTRKVHNKKEIDRIKRKQAADEKSFTGKNNKISITPKISGWLEKYNK
jgi:hypothetical protein